jgi:hypothetical protein
MELFEEKEINVIYQDFSCPHYPQHWSRDTNGFIPNLSILDLILNCGPDSLKVLTGTYEEIHTSF